MIDINASIPVLDIFSAAFAVALAARIGWSFGGMFVRWLQSWPTYRVSWNRKHGWTWVRIQGGSDDQQ